MPIRFYCKRCNQLLGIASRKAGSEIQCPKCGVSQVVPGEEAAAAAMAMNRFAGSATAVDNSEDLVVYDDRPAAIETAPRPRTEAVAAPTPTSSAEPEPGQPVPRGLILFPRRTLYVQALLFLVLAVVALTLGYLIGRGDADYQLQVEQEEAARERVPIRGELVCKSADGQVIGDENAVIIVLPEGKLPEQKLSFRNIRPRDPMPNPVPDPPPKNVRLIRELGGQYVRADAKGDFFTVLPDQGAYRILIVSGHAERPGAADIDEIDLNEIGDYFEMPEHLIGRQQYRWMKDEINVGFNPIEIEFDRTPQQ